MYVRQDVWVNGGTFDDPILYWYAKGVGELKKRPIADKTSWLFLAAIHGFNADLWANAGYTVEPLPDQDVQDKFWKQCQHGTWYFLPWHRGYILSLEANVRAAIEKIGGPADTWALPYWNYSDENNQNARDLPPAFSAEKFDGDDNPLYVVQRYGHLQTPASLPLPKSDVSIENTLKTSNFIGGFIWQSGGVISPSSNFGGTSSGFQHSGKGTGALEMIPHNFVHVDVGGRFGGTRGLMADPKTAGLDPIFFLHHANIDRLWQVWLNQGGSRQNPTEDTWLKGPVSPQRSFYAPMPTKYGVEDWPYTAEAVESTEALGYLYADAEPPQQTEAEALVPSRLERLAATPNA